MDYTKFSICLPRLRNCPGIAQFRDHSKERVFLQFSMVLWILETVDAATTFYRAVYSGQLSTNEIEQTNEPTTTTPITSTTTLTTSTTTTSQSSTSSATELGESKPKITEAK